MTYTNFSEKLGQIKSDLKLLASYIKAYNKDRKDIVCTNGYWSISTKNRDEFKQKYPQWTPPTKYDMDCKYHYRHMHLAYCLLRGRTMEQMEPNIRKGNEPNEKLIDTYVKKYMDIDDFLKNITTFRSQKPVIKMYVLIREDLEPIHRTVQGGHAIAKFLLENGDALRQTSANGTTHRWNNGYMVYLGIKDEQELIEWEDKLTVEGKVFSTFVEPDWGKPTKTAIACVDFGEIFSDLKLLTVKINKQKMETVIS